MPARGGSKRNKKRSKMERASRRANAQVIRARLVRQSGVIALESIAHADRSVCSAASMILQAAALGLRDLAKQFPKDITFTALIDGDLTDDIHSTDNRVRPKRKESRRANWR